MTGERKTILDSLRARLDALDPKDGRHLDLYDEILKEIAGYPMELCVEAWEIVRDERQKLLDELVSPTQSWMSLSGWLQIAVRGLSPDSRDRVYDEISAHFEDIEARLTREGKGKYSASFGALEELGNPFEINRHFRGSMITRRDQDLLWGLDHPQANGKSNAPLRNFLIQFCPLSFFLCHLTFAGLLGSSYLTSGMFGRYDWKLFVPIFALILVYSWIYSGLPLWFSKHGALVRALRWRIVAQILLLLGTGVFCYCTSVARDTYQSFSWWFLLVMTFSTVAVGHTSYTYERLVRKLAVVGATTGTGGAS